MPTCFDASMNPINCASASSTDACFDDNGNDVDCSSYSSTANVVGSQSYLQSSPAVTGAMSANGGATGGGAVPSVTSNGTSVQASELTALSSIVNAGANAYAVSQGAPVKPVAVVSPSGLFSTSSSTSILLIIVAIVVGFIFFSRSKK